MPLAMVVGAVLCRPVAAVDDWSGHMVTPVLIFLMLFVTFCRVRPREMRPSMLHVWLLVIQIAGCVAVYLALRPFDTVIAQGAMICILAPVAMAAVVIAGHAGRQRGHDGHLQPAVQHGRGGGRPRSAFVHGQRRVYLRRAARTHSAASDHALRRGAVLPPRGAARGTVGWATTGRYRSTYGCCRWPSS